MPHRHRQCVPETNSMNRERLVIKFAGMCGHQKYQDLEYKIVLFFLWPSSSFASPILCYIHYFFCFFFLTLLHTWNNSCIVGAFTNIERSHLQTARPGTTTCRRYKLFRAVIELTTRNAAVDHSATVPTVPSTSLFFGRMPFLPTYTKRHVMITLLSRLVSQDRSFVMVVEITQSYYIRARCLRLYSYCLFVFGV